MPEILKVIIIPKYYLDNIEEKMMALSYSPYGVGIGGSMEEGWKTLAFPFPCQSSSSSLPSPTSSSTEQPARAGPTTPLHSYPPAPSPQSTSLSITLVLALYEPLPPSHSVRLSCSRVWRQTPRIDTCPVLAGI